MEPVNSRRHERREATVEPGEIDGDDRTAGPGQPRDETVTDLATGPVTSVTGVRISADLF
jgi:hypothetical protein